MLVSWAPVMTEHVCLPCWQFWFICIALALAPTTNIGRQCVARRIRDTCRHLTWSHRCRRGPHGWICYCVCIWGRCGVDLDRERNQISSRSHGGPQMCITTRPVAGTDMTNWNTHRSNIQDETNGNNRNNTNGYDHV